MVFTYPGAIHIHTVHSDGTGTVEQIAKAAKKAGLSWIVITDHNNMDAKEGMYDDVCVIVGEEISPKDGNHYLALGIQNPILPKNPEEYIQEVKSQGGFGFIAHPDEKDFRKNSFKPLKWLNWDITDFDGIEIWNFLSNWADFYNEKNIFASIYAYLFRNKVLSGPTPKIMKCWDELNNRQNHIIPVIGGVDTHQLKVKKLFFKIKIFPYKNDLSTISNFIHLEEELPQEFEQRKEKILEAIKNGKNLIANRALSRNSKYIFCIKNNEKCAYAGYSIKNSTENKITVNLPKKANIKIFHNGEIILQNNAKTIELTNLKSGKYRMEAYLKNHPWVFSNPIIIE